MALGKEVKVVVVEVVEFGVESAQGPWERASQLPVPEWFKL